MFVYLLKSIQCVVLLIVQAFRPYTVFRNIDLAIDCALSVVKASQRYSVLLILVRPTKTNLRDKFALIFK